ncbi:hypothetical protein JRO89_XS13G0110200 [Xanthoceras sorbifolium]|uniref:SHSP domain-containing protein n=1 Tax=Xanthoceras sorbifolium TaxID=99658 RepID=A0ABQ8H7R4_9ROSI|nr:hypothetical protein JRO89_XS13G0110200 [Xanthoceras sorbifolium]
MAMILSFFGNQRNNGLFDPFSVDVWDPFRDFPVPFISVSSRDLCFRQHPGGLEERNVEKEDKSDTWHRVEGSSGKFSRRFRLPENVNMDQIKACMENGVLTVTAPKQEVKKPDVKAIEISG